MEHGLTTGNPLLDALVLLAIAAVSNYFPWLGELLGKKSPDGKSPEPAPAPAPAPAPVAAGLAATDTQPVALPVWLTLLIPLLSPLIQALIQRLVERLGRQPTPQEVNDVIRGRSKILRLTVLDDREGGPRGLLDADLEKTIAGASKVNGLISKAESTMDDIGGAAREIQGLAKNGNRLLGQ